MLLLLQGRVHRAALPRPRGCAEVTALLGGWDGAPPPASCWDSPQDCPSQSPASRTTQQGSLCWGHRSVLLLPEELSAIPFTHTLLCLLPPQAIKPSGKRLPGCRKACCRVFSIAAIPAGKASYVLCVAQTSRGQEQSGMRCTAAALDQPPALSASLPRASLRRRKLDFLLPLDLHPSAPMDLHPATPVAPVWERGRFSIAGRGGRSHPRAALAPLPPGSA